MSLLRHRAPWIVLLLIAGASAPGWMGAYFLGVFTTAYYFGVFAMSWDLLFGFAGEVNFGPTFLIGVGAYTAGLMNNAGIGIPLCLLGGSATAVVGGLLLALPALRLRGPYFGLVTLVAVLLLLDFIVIFAGVTGGEIGMMVPDVLSVSATINYWYAFGFLVISAFILYGLSVSSVGLILQATGQDRIEAAALGFNVTKHKLAAFCISALFSGLAGGLLTFYGGLASVDTVVSLSITVQIVIAVVFGGRRTILGAILGSIFLILAGELLRPLGQLNTFVVSAVALAVIIFFPDGALGWLLRPRDQA
ncbi:MAG TPA: branched-chain amino acid ABC transporter permease [Acetobacteraceae bacterium]|nr:branched-chain amino acid ABC transporter permease [Acetobacteraceae bacterium]